jgi:RHS repeat-associated protein
MTALVTRAAEIDPEGDKRTWGYNEDSQETSMVSPRGHVKAGEESKYTTTTERDAQGRPVKVTDPLGHETKYTYDGDGNVETVTDPEAHKTTYTYDADNERTKVEEPNKTITETEYDGAGQVKKQIDGNKHATEYVRNILEQVTEVVDPLGRKTLKEYDAAGNLTKLTDPLKRVTTYKYDKDNRLVEVSYSDGKTPTVKYGYNSDSDRTKMEDGTGTTTYEYDQLDRLTKTKDGHGDTVGYEYDLANEQTKITYPNGKVVEREYDKAGRLKSTTDWSKNVIKFTYDADSDLTATTFPSGTSDEDTYTYDDTDAMTEVKMKKSTETLASLVYTRNKDELVEKATSKGLPGEEKPAYIYDKNNRLTKGVGIPYEYDAANNPTTIGEHAYSYNAADELEKSVLKKVTATTYTYNETGERTKTEPAGGPATTYGYDQAGNLISVTRPKGTEVAAIEDAYGYNGDGLRTSETISGTTTYLAWDLAEKLPLILNDGTNSYIYGPDGVPIEQINNSSGTVLYLHHDQQDSTRLLTGSTGKTEATFTYDAYGNLTGSTGTTKTPLGYDGEYTNADTGLIYLRAREYDPTTAQFLSVDPRSIETLAPYGYAEDDPVTVSDPTGLIPWSKKVKKAIAKCGQLKTGPTKNNRHNPFYHNKSFYQSCVDLLHLPKEVYGSNAHGSGSSVGKYLSGVAQVVAGAATIAAGVVQMTFCLGGEVETDTGLHCIGVSTAVLSAGGVVFYHGAKEILESGVPEEVFVSGGTP